MTGTVGLGVDTANSMLNAFRHVAHDVITTYALMYTGVPGADGNTAISVGDSTLRAISFSAAADGNMSMATSPTFVNVGTTEVLSHVGFFDGPDGPGTDTLLWTAALTETQSWSDGDTYVFDDCGLVLAPIAAD